MFFKILFCVCVCSTGERMAYSFGMTWECVNDVRIFILQWNISLIWIQWFVSSFSSTLLLTCIEHVTAWSTVYTVVDKSPPERTSWNMYYVSLLRKINIKIKRHHNLPIYTYSQNVAIIYHALCLIDKSYSPNFISIDFSLCVI